MFVTQTDMEFQQTTKELNTYRVLVLCAIVILLEGFDIQAAGVSAPKLTLAFNLDPFGKGMFLGASAVGIFIASVLGGFLADKYGRKPIVVSGVIIFGIFSLSTLFSTGLGTLIAARFMTGLGLGSAMPATWVRVRLIWKCSKGLEKTVTNHTRDLVECRDYG